ncbi:MAG: GNAT family N-acetyltransferase [Sphingomonas bacterium]
MSEVVFREATAADLPAIVALLDDDDLSRGREDASLPLDARYLAAFEAISADPNQLQIVADLGGRVVGTMQLSFLAGIAFRGSWRGQIEAVRIARDLRGQGLGQQMIQWAVERCRERGCRMAQLTSKLDRIDAHRFYERMGWKKSHTGFKLQLEQP